jgi:hypothetical protein
MKKMKPIVHLFGAKKNSTVDISTKKTFCQQLKLERSRTHRNGIGFSVVVFNLKALRLKRENVVKMIHAINCQIHDYDHIGWYGRNKIGVILPYASSKEAKEFSKNIINPLHNVRQESKYTLLTYPPEKIHLKKNQRNIEGRSRNKPSRKVA